MDLIFQKFSLQNPIFHSKADLKERFARFLKAEIPGSEVDESPSLSRVDLLLNNQGNIYAFYFMYKTRNLQTVQGNEHYHLKNHSAQDISRYDFLKGIELMEKTIEEKGYTGYVILLTNEHLYWEPSSKEEAVDQQLKIHDHSLKTGKMNWGEHASEGTKENREKPIVLKGAYTIRWKNFSEYPDLKNGLFRYSIANVE